MSFVWSTAAKDLKRHARDSAGLVSWIGLPLVIGILLISMAGGDEGPKPQAHVLVADRDDSFLSNVLVGALSQDAAGGFVQAEEVDEGDGRARLQRSDGLAVEGADMAAVGDHVGPAEQVRPLLCHHLDPVADSGRPGEGRGQGGDFLDGPVGGGAGQRGNPGRAGQGRQDGGHGVGPGGRLGEHLQSTEVEPAPLDGLTHQPDQSVVV